jgi:hypothetical protein
LEILGVRANLLRSTIQARTTLVTAFGTANTALSTAGCRSGRTAKFYVTLIHLSPSAGVKSTEQHAAVSRRGSMA